MIIEGSLLPVACTGPQCQRAIYTIVLRVMKAWTCCYIFCVFSNGKIFVLATPLQCRLLLIFRDV